MLEYLPQHIRDGLDAARKSELKRQSRLRVRVGGTELPVLRLWEGGLALDADQMPQLRGLVDLYDGARHVCHCLIVLSTVENGELICEFKRATPASETAALDFWKDENAPVGYLPRH
ncbi:hypothetical protein [Cereibacter changlensis]|uniref:hypothetical protein n=1 Tax=Cereibacter changlensis TaxID=402884 RepID=UPI0040339FE6